MTDVGLGEESCWNASFHGGVTVLVALDDAGDKRTTPVGRRTEFSTEFSHVRATKMGDWTSEA